MMDSVNARSGNTTDDLGDRSETSRGTFSIAVLVGAISFASLMMAIAIIAAAQSVQI
jgi:hypothetical protein